MILAMSVVAGILIGMVLIAVSNVFTFIRLAATPGSRPCPSVSVLIPARNEATVIGQTILALQRQRYPHYEVIVLDDDSSDSTAEIVWQLARDVSRVRLVAGQSLPDGWIGKNWACHQLSRLASGEYLIFADADVHWEPDALGAVMAVMTSTRADALAVWPTQVTKTWGERLVVPLMAMTVLGYLPCLFVHHLHFDSMAAAIGQCLVFRRGVYDEIRGARIHKGQDIG